MGGPTFSREGGFNCLFPIETYITCDFPVPPLDPHLPRIGLHVFYSFNFQDYSLYFQSCFNLSSCLKYHCHSFTFSLFLRPDEQSPCHNAR